MNYIRQATVDDLVRIAEIFVFNYRLNFYPIFQKDTFYFEDLTVFNMVESFAKELDSIWVYDDGVVKGFIQIEKRKVRRLFVEPTLQGKSIGADLLEYGIAEKDVDFLWVLEKNIKAIVFYKKHGFDTTNKKKYKEDTIEFLVRMER
jgi:acetyltransferase, GNAT family